MPKYLPKMIPVEAYDLQGLRYWDYSKYPDWLRKMINNNDITEFSNRSKVHVTTCEGVRTISHEDYIFRDDKGDIYAMKKDIFLDKYEIVREGGK